MSFAYNQIRAIGGIIKQPTGHHEVWSEFISHKQPEESHKLIEDQMTFLSRKLDGLSQLRSSSDIGVVPIRFMHPDNTNSIISAVWLIDIHNYSKAGFLLFNSNQGNSNYNITSVFNMLLAFGYEAHVYKSGELAEWLPYDPQTASLKQKFDHLVVNQGWRISTTIRTKLDGKPHFVDYSAEEQMPGLPVELVKEVMKLAKAHWKILEDELVKKLTTFDSTSCEHTAEDVYKSGLVSTSPQGHVIYPLGNSGPGIHPVQT